LPAVAVRPLRVLVLRDLLARLPPRRPAARPARLLQARTPLRRLNARRPESAHETGPSPGAAAAAVAGWPHRDSHGTPGDDRVNVGPADGGTHPRADAGGDIVQTSVK